MTRRWLVAWTRANLAASCNCEKNGVADISDPILDWAYLNEHWNTYERGHLIAASLMLDGMPSGDGSPE